MEAVIALMLFERLESADRESFFVGNRITVRSQYDADTRIICKLQVDLVESSVDAGFKYINNVCLHTRKHNLCLRIAEAGIVLEHLRSVRCQHQSEEDNSLKRSSLGCHRIYGRLIDIFFTELIHFFGIERTRGEVAHTAGVQAGVAVSCSLVVLCGTHRLDRLSIHKGENGNLTSGHKLLDDHLVSGTAEFLVEHDRLDALFCFL